MKQASNLCKKRGRIYGLREREAMLKTSTLLPDEEDCVFHLNGRLSSARIKQCENEQKIIENEIMHGQDIIKSNGGIEIQNISFTINQRQIAPKCKRCNATYVGEPGYWKKICGDGCYRAFDSSLEQATLQLAANKFQIEVISEENVEDVTASKQNNSDTLATESKFPNPLMSKDEYIEWRQQNISPFIGLTFKDIKIRLIALFGNEFVTMHGYNISRWLIDKKFQNAAKFNDVIEKNKPDQQDEDRQEMKQNAKEIVNFQTAPPYFQKILLRQHDFRDIVYDSLDNMEQSIFKCQDGVEKLQHQVEYNLFERRKETTSIDTSLGKFLVTKKQLKIRCWELENKLKEYKASQLQQNDLIKRQADALQQQNDELKELKEFRDEQKIINETNELNFKNMNTNIVKFSKALGFKLRSSPIQISVEPEQVCVSDE